MSSSSAFAMEPFCYLTTRGRASGLPHRIEIWFALDGDTLYLLSGGRERTDWVKNLRQTPQVTVELANVVFTSRARVVEDEDERARALVHGKYTGSDGGDLTRWRRHALPIAVDIEQETRTRRGGSR